MNHPVKAPHHLLAIFLPLALLSVASAAELPYGHADFYPSADRPAQMRGDGTGSFPGAKPVGSFDFRSKENIVWACPLPGWGFSSAIVVGDKVFVTCDWNKLVCINARDGKVLWAKDNHTFADVGGDADALRQAFTDVTEPWLQAHALLFEKEYLRFKIDTIKSARAGGTLEPSGAAGKKKSSGWGGRCPGDHLTEQEKTDLLATAKQVDDAALARLQARLEQVSKEAEDNEIGPQTSGYVPTLSPYKRASAAEKKLRADSKRNDNMGLLKKHHIIFEIWNGWMSRSFSTPASDGTHVYAQFGQSQIVCYDLAGNRKWMTVVPDVNASAGRQETSASPVLLGDKLVVLMGGKDYGGYSYIQALDKNTGKMLWQTKVEFQRESHSFPNQTVVNHDGIQAIAAAGAIVSIEDGSIIMGGLPAPIAPPLVVGSDVYYTCGAGQSNGQGSRVKVQLRKEGEAIVGKIAWAYINSKFNTWGDAVKKNNPDIKVNQTVKKPIVSNVGTILVDGKIMTAGTFFDAQTGAIVPNAIFSFGKKKGKPLSATGHLIRAGDLVFGNANRLEVNIYDLSAGKMPAVSKGYLGSEWHRQLQLGLVPLEEMVKNIVEFPWLPVTGGHLGGQTSPWPQGDRLYFRQMDTLYCIGDPAKAYHSPAGAPAAAKTGG